MSKRVYTPLCRVTAFVLSLVLLNPAWSLAQVTLSSGGGSFTGGAVTGATSFLDGTNFKILGTADNTKVLSFDLSGKTTATTTTLAFNGGTMSDATGQVVFPLGSTTNPSISFNGFLTSGITAISGNLLLFEGGTIGAVISTTSPKGLRITSDFCFDYSSATNNLSAADTFLCREAGATVQLGVDVNGAPVNQIFKAHDGITGTDVKGAGLALKPGLGTGAAVSNPVELFRDVTKATGTTAQTYAQAEVHCPTKILSTTSGVAQTIATITTTTTSAGGVSWFFTTTASNGTAVDAETGDINVAWNNNAGTVAATASAALGAVQSNGSGTLAATPTVTAATNVVSLKYTPTWTVITPTLVTGFATFIVSGVDSVVCQ